MTLDREVGGLLVLFFSVTLSGLASGCTTPRARGATIVLRPTGVETKPGRFEVDGLDGPFLRSPEGGAVNWADVLTVSVVPADGASGELPSILGTARIEDGRLYFEPRYPFEPGLTYRARLRLGPWSRPLTEGILEETVALPAPILTPTTSVLRIDPTAETLPENLLKFYIHFSGPMRRGNTYAHLHLVESPGGREVEAPFLELGEELWDPTGTRFTLFIDPGRIKRGVLPHEELGPALQSGKHYSLIVDAGLRDATGAHLAAGATRSFGVGDPDYDPPDPGRWKVIPPRARTREPLVLQLGEPLDRALLERLLHVVSADGHAIEGEAAVLDADRVWSFSPAVPWADGPHQVVVQVILEDLAGNQIGRPFEVDPIRQLDRQLEARSVSVSFEPAKAP